MWNERRIEPAGDGGYLLRLPEEERQLLRFLPDELRSLLEVMPGDPALRRLFPRAYEDEQDEAAYRELMGNELAEGRNRALAAARRKPRRPNALPPTRPRRG